MFRDVRIYTQRAPEGVVVTFEVFERPTIRHVKFIGNRGLSDKGLLKESGLEIGEAMNVYSIEEARRKTEELYHKKGYPHAQVVVDEGKGASDQGAVFSIYEGPLQRISSVEFVGNTIASDARLKTLTQSKPGFFWYLFRGKVDQDKIDEDLDGLRPTIAGSVSFVLESAGCKSTMNRGNGSPCGSSLTKGLGTSCGTFRLRATNALPPTH